MKRNFYFVNQFISSMLIVALIVTLFSVNSSAAKMVKLNRTKITLHIGETTVLELKNNTKKVKWLSNKKNVATVTQKGMVVARKKGTAIICAKVGKKEYKCTVIVKKQDAEDQNNQKKLKVSEIFNSSKKRVWFGLHKLAYNADIWRIYVIEKGSVKVYSMNDGSGRAQWQPTLEDLDGKSDKEIIDFIKEKKEKVKAIDASIEFLYRRDSTGNKIKAETIHFDGESWEARTYFEIGGILEPETILSTQFFGFRSDEGAYLITKYEPGIKIILNELGDKDIVED